MTNEVVTTAGGLPMLDDAALALMEQAGAEHGFKASDLQLPWLQIVQSGSPYVKRTEPEYIAEAREGDIIDNLTHRLRARATIVPCHFEVHYTEWKKVPAGQRGGLVKQWFADSSKYDACGDAFGTRETADDTVISPAPTYYALLIEEDGGMMPVVLGMPSTQAKKARRLNSLIAMLEFRKPDGSTFPAPMFARAYDFTTVPESNDQGSWMGWKFDPGPLTLTLPNGMAIFKRAEALKKSVMAGEVRPAPPAENVESGSSSGASRRTARQPGEPQGDEDIPF